MTTGSRPVAVYAAVAVVVAVIWLAILPGRPLFNPDEGRYAEIPREMLSGGDWVIPHLDGLVYIEKPPLQYWATAALYTVFGATVGAARLYTALCALATLAVVGFTGARLWGRAAGWRAAAALGGMWLFVVMGQLLTLDMSLTFYLTSSLAAFLLAQRAATGAARGWMLLAWLAAALGVLTKGLVAAAVPAAVLVLHSLYTRDGRPWRRLHVLWGIPLFLIVTVPWHWLAARRLPSFLEFFFVHEHVARYLTPSADREEPWWFFAAVFMVGSVPWTVAALRVVITGWRRSVAAEFDAALFVWLWAVFIGVFFSLSDSKLIPYVLPALPAVALGVAALPLPVLRGDLKVTGVLSVGVALALLSGAIYAPHVMSATGRNVYFLALAPAIVQIAALLGITGAAVLRWSRDPTRMAVTLGVGWCLAGLLFVRSAAAVAPIYSGVVLARAAPNIPAETPIYSVALYDQSLPFYWRRTVELVSYRGELDFGLRLNPDMEIANMAEFLDRWRNAPQAYAVMEASLFDDLTARGVPLKAVGRDAHRVLAARR